MKAAGIDGCRAGWFCVVLGPGENWEFSVLADARQVARVAAQVDSLLIDVPIGLLSYSIEERACDKEARGLLGPLRGSSVFPAPVREALQASTYREAVEMNKRSTGRGLSQQSWAIVKKIREIDELLQRESALRGRIRECHPEVCFRALNGGLAMRHNKKTLEGRRDRIDVLRKYFPDVEALLDAASGAFRRKDLARDDVLDALVAAVSARGGHGAYETVPVAPAQDSTGLPMEIVYWGP